MAGNGRRAGDRTGDPVGGGGRRTGPARPGRSGWTSRWATAPVDRLRWSAGSRRPACSAPTAAAPAGPRGRRAGRDEPGPGHGPDRGRQHPPVHGHRRPVPQGELRLRRPARLLHRRRPRRRPVRGRPQRGRHPDGAVVADAGPQRGRPAGPGRRPPADPDGPRGRPPPGRPRRHQPGPAQRHPARAVRQRLGRPRLGGRHTVGVEELERLVAGWPPERAAEVCGVDAGQIREAPASWARRAAAVHRPPGRLPVPPGHRGRLPGQQAQPAPRHDRPPRLRGAADERPADGREHPRVRADGDLPGFRNCKTPAVRVARED